MDRFSRTRCQANWIILVAHAALRTSALAARARRACTSASDGRRHAALRPIEALPTLPMSTPHDTAPESTVDPNAAADPDAGLFGLDHGFDEAELIVTGAPFDATCSFRRGAAGGPAAILEASHQVELYCPVAGEPWKRGIHMQALDPAFEAWNAEARTLADKVIAVGGRIAGDPELEAALARVNAISAEVDARIAAQVAGVLDAGKRSLLLGGDHSTALGSIRAHAARHEALGILHLDAHADLRVAFEGFERSHASVLYNALDAQCAPELGPAEHITSLVQVGLRDLCPAEVALIDADPRIHAVYDHDWSGARARGKNLLKAIRKAIARLPEHVYVSVDIDGLDPSLCPHTGTPVPGGLQWHETWMWLAELRDSGRTVVGADLVEVAPGEPGKDLDTVVAARLAWRLLGVLS